MGGGGGGNECAKIESTSPPPPPRFYGCTATLNPAHFTAPSLSTLGNVTICDWSKDGSLKSPRPPPSATPLVPSLPLHKQLGELSLLGGQNLRYSRVFRLFRSHVHSGQWYWLLPGIALGNPWSQDSSRSNALRTRPVFVVSHPAERVSSRRTRPCFWTAQIFGDWPDSEALGLLENGS